jgi:hypothetical protein
MKSQRNLVISHGLLPDLNRRSSLLKHSGRSANIPAKDRILLTKQIYTETSIITPNKRSTTPMIIRNQSRSISPMLKTLSALPNERNAHKVRSKSRIPSINQQEMTELEKLYLPAKLKMRQFVWSPDMKTYGFEEPESVKKLIKNWMDKHIKQEIENTKTGPLYIMPELAKEIMTSQKMKM